MADSSFDPAGFYDFDLSRGEVRARGGARVLVLSDSALGPLVAAAAKAKDVSALRRLGKHIGEVAAASLDDPAAATPERAGAHIAQALALFGFGRLKLETWGPALVARVDGAPELDDRRLGLAGLLGGVFSSLASREVGCAPVGDAFLICDPAVADEVWGWSRAGADLPTCIGRLETGSAA